MSGKGKTKEKRARPSSSASDKHEECGRHYEELQKLYKTLEQKDAEKSVAIAGLQALLATAKDEIKALNDKLVALETSLQFTQAEHDEVKERVATCENEQIRQESELTRQSIYSRRWNLLFFKINETEGESCNHLVRGLLKTDLKIEESRVDNMPLCGVHRLGKKRPNANQPRPIIVRFTCRAERDYVWRQRRLLEGSNIRIAEDLPFHIREIRKNFLVPALKKAKQVANAKASIVGDKLVVNGHRYTFNNIPMQWRNTQSQDQYVQAQETGEPDETNTTEMEPLQGMPEIT